MAAMESTCIVNVRFRGRALMSMVAAAISATKLFPSERTVPPPLVIGMCESVVMCMPYPEFSDFLLLVSVDPSVYAIMC